MVQTALKFQIDVDALRKLQSKLLPEELYDNAMKDAFDRLAASGLKDAISGAPVLTGRLQASIIAKTSKAKLARWAAVVVKAKSHSGYEYPRMLEFSRKHHHKDWLINAVRKGWGLADDELDRAAREIERIWAGL